MDNKSEEPADNIPSVDVKAKMAFENLAKTKEV